MKKSIWLLICLGMVNVLFGQNLRDLFYAQPNGTGLYLGLKPMQGGGGKNSIGSS